MGSGNRIRSAAIPQVSPNASPKKRPNVPNVILRAGSSWVVIGRSRSVASAVATPLSDGGDGGDCVLHERVEAASGQGIGTLVGPLTNREEEVLSCLFHGQSNKAIARSMFVSVDTVKTHLKRIYVKLGVADRQAAVDRARELNFTPDSAP